MDGVAQVAGNAGDSAYTNGWQFCSSSLNEPLRRNDERINKKRVKSTRDAG